MKFFDKITNENGLDFPFYNGKPKLSKFDWLVFSLAPILTISVIFGMGILYSWRKILD